MCNITYEAAALQKQWIQVIILNDGKVEPSCEKNSFVGKVLRQGFDNITLIVPKECINNIINMQHRAAVGKASSASQ